MKLSMKWLGDFVKIDTTPREYAHVMTMSGSKVEGYEEIGAEISGVVVGKILSVEPHPDADKLVVCSVDTGGSEPLQIVTGATNVAAGDLVPVATNGATLPGGVKIKKGKLRGVTSEGMLCSLSELGLTVADFPYAIEDGIFILQEPCEIGQDIRSAVGLDDTVVEFEITPNRPDCLSVLGLARETAASFHIPFHPPAVAVTEIGGDIREHLTVSVEAPDLCPRYMARMVKNVKIGPSPRFIRERLRACGIRPISNIVDITNYVMLETGQPMHAFDYSLIEGGKIVVRRAKDGESITTLDGDIHELSGSNLVIADGKKPVAVAGVMGGEYSGINEHTTTIIFESANFDGVSVRLTARGLGMRTDSSARFEKGLDPENCAAALDRACQLINLLGCGDVVGGVIDCRTPAAPPVKIPFDAKWIGQFLGISLPEEEMHRILTALEFRTQDGMVIPPSFRSDVAHKADLAEEIARFYGYDKIPGVPLSGSAQSKRTPDQKFADALHAAAVGLGFHQIMTYSFISPKFYDKIRLPEDSPRRNSVKIRNPLGEDTSLMRTTAIPSMLDILARNYSNRNQSAALYELATEYIPSEDSGQLPLECQKLILGVYGEGEDFFTLKGAVESILSAVGVAEVEFAPVSDRPEFHPGRCAQLLGGGKALGTLGEVHPAVLEQFELETRCWLAELDVELLKQHTAPEKLYRPLPKFPASTRDLALICDVGLPAGELQRAIQAGGGKLLESVELFDLYQGSQIPKGKKSLAYRITLRAADRTLTDSETEAAMAKIMSRLTDLGAQLRS